MYLNAILFRNGETFRFYDDEPYTPNMIVNECWNIVVDKVTDRVISFKGSEVVVITSDACTTPSVTAPTLRPV